MPPDTLHEAWNHDVRYVTVYVERALRGPAKKSADTEYQSVAEGDWPISRRGTSICQQVPRICDLPMC